MNYLVTKVNSLFNLGRRVSKTLNEGEYLTITSFENISGFYMQVEDRKIELTIKEEHFAHLSSNDMEAVCGDDPGFDMFIDTPRSWDCKSDFSCKTERLYITWEKK